MTRQPNPRKLAYLEAVGSIKNERIRTDALREVLKDPQIYKLLKQVCLNCKKKNLKLSAAQKVGLRRYTKTILQLASKTSKKTPKEVVQVGKFLPILVPTLAAIATELIASKFMK